MKITVIGPVYPYRGGIAHFTTALCQELSGAGHQVQAISFKRQYPSWLYPGQSDKDPSAVHDQFPALYTLDPFYFWTWGKALRQVVDFQPDLVIIQWWTTFWAPVYFILSVALKQRGISCVFCIHNVVPHERRLPDVILSRSVLSQGKACITLSPKESDRLIKLLPTAKIFQSRLPVPKNEVSAVDRDSIRRAMGIAPEQKVLIFFGIVRPYKGLKILIEALGILKERQVEPVLIVTGEFWENVQQYRDQILQLGLEGKVILENRYVPNEELANFFAAADAFVAPYTQGTQSAAIKVAMSYHLPILASDQISGDLNPEEYPILIHRAGDAVDLANSIRSFLNRKPEDWPQAADDKKGWGELVGLIEDLPSQLRKITH